MLDPLTALSLASSIVQLVDFSAKVVSESRQIYQAGSAIQNDELEIISNDLLDLVKTVELRSNKGASHAGPGGTENDNARPLRNSKGPSHAGLGGTENDNARPQVDHQVPKFF